MGWVFSACAAGGTFFNVTLSGMELSIHTTVPNHFYPIAGIKINTPGYVLTGIGSQCTPASNGYCLFSVSDDMPATMSLSGPIESTKNINITLCLNGRGALSCQNYTLSLGGPHLYVTTNSSISLGAGIVSEYSLDGTVINATLISGLTFPQGIAFGTNGHLYVSSYLDMSEIIGVVGEYYADGTVINAALIPGLHTPGALAFGPNGHLYVSSATTVREYTADGSLIRVISGSSQPLPGLAFGSNDHLYTGTFAATATGTINEYTANGVPVYTPLITGISLLGGIAFGVNGHLYVSNVQSVSEYDANGTLINPFLISGLITPKGLVFDAYNDLYVANYAGGGLGQGRVGKYKADGTSINSNLITGLTRPVALAIH